MYGYAGKLLFVDLSSGKTEVKDLPEEWARDFVGGPALGARVLWEYMPKNTPAFDEKSMVGFVPGAFNNTPVLFGGRYTTVSKSPITNGWNDASSGGYFGPAIRKAGFDGIFVNGISEKPVYIYVNDGKAEIREASFMWGMTISDAEKALYVSIEDQKAKYSMIGPMGEKMAYTAAVMNDGHRAAARGGTAAVMGSKKLKAVVCGGAQKIELFDKDAVIEINLLVREKFLNSPLCKGFSINGTSFSTMGAIKSGDANVKNWATSLEGAGQTPEDYKEFDGFVFNPKYMQKQWGCSNCPARCGAILKIDEGPWPLEHTARPEYESLGLFGPGMLNTDPFSMFKANDLCNEYGVDCISVAGTVAWAMETFSNGQLKPKDLDGINLTWGNSEAIVAITEKLCKGEGCGKILMHGSKYASDYYGVGAEFLVLAGNLEISAHDSRRVPAYARTYYCDPTPARHVKGGASRAHGGMPEEKLLTKVTGFFDVLETNAIEYANSVGLCRFGNLFATQPIMYTFYPAVTGFESSDQACYFRGIRSFTMRTAFNMREGIRRKDFSISPRLLGPLEDGPTKGISVDVQRLTDNFYNAIGYNEDGFPRKDMLALMGGMESVIKELYPEK